MVKDISIDIGEYELKKIFGLYGSCSFIIVNDEGIITFSKKKDGICAYENLQNKFNLKILSLGNEKPYERKEPKFESNINSQIIQKTEKTNNSIYNKNDAIPKIKTDFILLRELLKEYPNK